MKAMQGDIIRTLVPISSEFQDSVYPPGLCGDVIEVYEDPEACAVDLAIPDADVDGGYRYDNVILRGGDFSVVMRQIENIEQARSA